MTVVCAINRVTGSVLSIRSAVGDNHRPGAQLYDSDGAQ